MNHLQIGKNEKRMHHTRLYGLGKSYDKDKAKHSLRVNPLGVQAHEFIGVRKVYLTGFW